MPKEKVYKWRGRFVKQTVFEAMLKRSQNARDRLKKRLVQREHQEEQRKLSCIQGNRIIDINYMSDQMYCKFCGEKLLMQYIEKENISGLASTFQVRCHECLVLNTVKSGREHVPPSSKKPVFCINTKVALGAVHTGSGQSQLNELFTIMDLPKLNPQLFKNHERIIGPVIEFVAKESCSEATAMERILTVESVEEIKKLLPPDLQEGFLIVNYEKSESSGETIVRIFASYDMGWSQRGNGYSYDSLNGYCALIGLKTSKVLDFCTRNRKCRICDLIAKTGIHKDHDCRLNFTGSAKAMEADGAVELVTRSNILKEANVQVGVFIGDNDSSSIAAIQEVSTHTIIKQSDINHSTKNIGKSLQNVHNDRNKDPEKELSTDVIKHIQRCFTFAVHQNKGDIAGIQSALRNVPDHLYDHHTNCGSWCKHETDNQSGIRLSNLQLYETLKSCFSDLADNAYKFCSAASSQANESLNHTMCSKAPKSQSYSTSESADYRFAATVAQKNSGKNYLNKCMNVLDIAYNKENLEEHAKNYDQSIEKRKCKSNKPEYKKIRLENKIKRAQLRNKKEKSDIYTYQSGMSLIDPVQPNNVSLIHDVSSEPYKYENPQFAIIFFDLETTSLSSNCDIIQVSMKCHQYSLNVYITPTQPIQNSASKVNGFSKVHKKLFQHGQEVPSISKKEASKKIIEFFELFEKKCILVAHNCTFDSTRLLHMVKQLSLQELYEEYIYAFCDTLQMFRHKFPKKKSGYKLTTLAGEQDLSCVGAHDAQFDVCLLEKLCLQNFELKDITDAATTWYQVLEKIENNENTQKILPSFEPMKDVLSSSMQKKLASHGITYNKILETFDKEGKEKTILLLQNKVDGCSTLMKSMKPINKVLEYLTNLKRDLK